jgi:hypothetical protein
LADEHPALQVVGVYPLPPRYHYVLDLGYIFCHNASRVD